MLQFLFEISLETKLNSQRGEDGAWCFLIVGGVAATLDAAAVVAIAAAAGAEAIYALDGPRLLLPLPPQPQPGLLPAGFV